MKSMRDLNSIDQDEIESAEPQDICETAPLSFIRELAEARMTRSASRTEALSYNDVCERAYLCLLILELMRQFANFRKTASSYAQDTVKYSGFDNFRMSSTDLYNFLYFVTGDERAMQRLREPARALEMRNRTTLPTLQVSRYLRKVARGTQPDQVSQLFMRLEKELRITEPQYKSIRRVVTNLPKSSKQNIESAVTKLLFATRTKLRSSDLITNLESLAQAKDLESPQVPDDEVLATKPDLVVKNTDLMYLQRLVGTKNLFLAMKYIQMSSQGKTIPSHLVQAFNPALEVLVDIIRGGPAFIAGLKRIQKSAKQARRRQ